MFARMTRRLAFEAPSSDERLEEWTGRLLPMSLQGDLYLALHCLIQHQIEDERIPHRASSGEELPSIPRHQSHFRSNPSSSTLLLLLQLLVCLYPLTLKQDLNERWKLIGSTILSSQEFFESKDEHEEQQAKTQRKPDKNLTKTSQPNRLLKEVQKNN